MCLIGNRRDARLPTSMCWLHGIVSLEHGSDVSVSASCSRSSAAMSVRKNFAPSVRISIAVCQRGHLELHHRKTGHRGSSPLVQPVIGL
jgi:hypothetical protein